MLHLLSNAHLGINHLFEIVRVPDLERVELRVLKVSGQFASCANEQVLKFLREQCTIEMTTE